jgi:phosphatidylserine decarboxylase
LVAVGALLVGSIEFTVTEGDKVQKGQELGYFAYGGSTVIVLFPEDMGVEFDEDMSNWSKNGLETILQVGQGVATSKTAAS